MKRYLFFWLLLTGLILLMVAVFNVIVDPHGLFYWVNRPGLNLVKPKTANYTKAYQVLRAQPRTLILGNSRSEVGFDPEHAAWPEQARPVYNLGLPGKGTATTLQYLQHALAAGGQQPSVKPEKVIWGLDFIDFLRVSAVTDATKVPPPEDPRLLMHSDGSNNSARWRQQLRDYAESTLTLGALQDSILTVASQSNPYATNLTSLGFNPMHDYRKIVADEGYWSVFRQKDIGSVRTYVARPTELQDPNSKAFTAFNDLREVIRLCREKGIQLHLLVYPYHAHLLEVIRITGHWPAFEAWKRAVVQVLEEESRDATQVVPFWDFSAFNDYTSESIPEKNDRRSAMLWYWEAGHFKNELGGLMLSQMLKPDTQGAGWGLQLHASNIDSHLVAINAQEAAYRQAHQLEINLLERDVADFSSAQHRGKHPLSGAN